uniref:Hypothetical chloroplast RF62 n=1 Tax=Watanabea reniformis TaxID=191674 RepID=A0A097KKA6_9CHLO|nr:hypothetical chloroplast RF62 [Watanabea reniformis]AIT93625.1 hypothetical chloroplast RF62 [Watanabea reniformis]
MRNKLNKNFEIVNTIQQTLQCKQLVNPDEYALLAVSGGQDSIGLLITFYFLKTQWNWVGGMVWCHHLWQKDSFYTMVQLARLGFCFQLPTYFAINSDVPTTSFIELLSKPRQGVTSKTNLVSFPSPPPLVEGQHFVPSFATSEANAFKYVKNMRRRRRHHLWWRRSPSVGRTPKVIASPEAITNGGGFHRSTRGGWWCDANDLQKMRLPSNARSADPPPKVVGKDLKNKRLPPKVFATGESIARSADPPPKVVGKDLKNKRRESIDLKNLRRKSKKKEKVKEGARKDNKEFKTSKAVFTEKNARDWRHRLNQRICFFYNYNFCVQGHNGSDRVETVLFNLMRGSGKNGVCALQWTHSRAPFSLNKFYCADSQQFRKPTQSRRNPVPVHNLRMKTKYYYQVKSVLNVSSYPLERTL